MGTCIGPECDRVARATKYLCGTHYQQLRKRGYLLAIGKTPDEHPKRFKELIYKRKDGCWEWMGPTHEHGYGRFNYSIDKVQKVKFAHRYSYELEYGVELASSDTLDHLCRFKMCVNPEHLEPVSKTENTSRARLYKELKQENERLKQEIEQLRTSIVLDSISQIG